MTATVLDTVLDPFVRGDTFRYEFDLGNDWLGVDFSGGVKFTLRKRLPATTITSDTDASVVDQATTDANEITFNGEVGTVIIPASRTQNWPAPKKLYWDIQGVVASTGFRKTIDGGTIEIESDVTRS
jgi:hypothetical protein